MQNHIGFEVRWVETKTETKVRILMNYIQRRIPFLGEYILILIFDKEL